MKLNIKGLAFVGFAAAVFASAANAYTKVNPVTDASKGVVTSKYYVDTAANSLKDDIDTKQATLQVTGSATQPVYVSAEGTVTATTYQLNKTVPADAVFTDTTYNNFTGADGTDAGASGLVPAPAATDNTKFLQGDGTWGTPANTEYDTLDAATIATGTETTGKLISASVLKAELDDKQETSTAVTHTASTAVGSATQPVYIATNGTATATTYELNKTVPADAVFTDTTYTASGYADIDENNNITVTVDGSVANGDTGLVTGGAVYTAIQSATNGNTIPSMPAGCKTSGVNCALVATGNGTTSSLDWVVMAGNN